MGGVFISYRGEDSQSYGALLHSELSRRFGADQVFLDSESTPAGEDFVEVLLSRLRTCSVLLAVIGPRWLTVTDDAGRPRIDSPEDWVRRELVEAFAHGMRVIPILTDGVQIPCEADLPNDIAWLHRRQALRMHHRNTSHDLARIVEELTGMDPQLDEAARRPGGVPRQVPAVPRQVVDTDVPEDDPGALVDLGVLLEEQGDAVSARDAYQRAIDLGHPEAASRAALNLGHLCQKQDDLPAARTAYQSAINSGHPGNAPLAAVGLGVLLKEHDDPKGAIIAFEEVVRSGHQDLAPHALNQLGVLYEEQGDVQAARNAFQQAVDSSHPDEGPDAAVSLGMLLDGLGEVQAARAVYQWAADSGHPEHAPRAEMLIGFLCAEQGDIAGAQVAYQRAIDSGDELAVKGAREALASLRTISQEPRSKTFSVATSHWTEILWGANSVTFSPDGKLLAVGCGHAVLKGAVRFFDIDSGRQLSVIRNTGFMARIVSVAISPDGILLATEGDDNRVRIWEVNTGRLLRTFKGGGHKRTWGPNSVAFSPDGTRIATCGPQIRDVGNGDQLINIDALSYVYGVAFSPDGRRLASAGVVVQIWDADNGFELRKIFHEGPTDVCGVAFSPDGTRLATAGKDGTARVWQVDSGRQLISVTHGQIVYGAAISSNGWWLATASKDNTARVWDLDTGTELARVPHSDQVRGVAFSPDSRHLATASWDGTMKVVQLFE